MTDELAGLPEALEGAWAAIKNVDTWNALREYVERLAGDLNAERLRADTYVAKYEVAHERLQLLAASQNERADNALELWRRAEAELAALKRRIAEAPKADVHDDANLGPSLVAYMDVTDLGKTFALLPVGGE